MGLKLNAIIAAFLMTLAACGANGPTQAQLNELENENNNSGNCSGYTGVFKYLGPVYGGPNKIVVYNGINYQIAYASNANLAESWVTSESNGNVPLTQNVCFTGSMTSTGQVYCDDPSDGCPTGPLVTLTSIESM